MAGAGNPVAGIDIVARLDKFRAEMAQIPDIGGKEAKALTAQLSKEIRAAELAAKRAADATKKAGQSAGEAAKGFKVLKEAAGAAGYGDLAEKAGKFGTVLEALASPAGLVAAGLGAMAASAILGVAALGEAVFAADDALDALEGFKRIGSDFYPRVPQDTIDSIDAVNASTTALGSIFDRAVVTLGASVAPAFEHVANVAVGLALAAEEAFEVFVQGTDVLHAFAVEMVQGVVEAITLPIKPLQILAAGVAAVAIATGHDLPAGAKDAIDSFLDLQHQVAESAVTFVETSVAGGALGAQLDELGEKGAAFIATQEHATRAMAAGKNAAKEQAAEYESLALAQEHVAEATAQLTAGIQALLLDAQATYDGMLTGEAKLTAAYEADLKAIEARTAAALAWAKTEDEAAAVRAAGLRDQEAHEAAYYANLDQLRKEDAKKQEEADKKAADAAQKQLELIGRSANQVAGYVSGAIGGMQAGFEASYQAAANNVSLLTQQLADGEDYYTDAQKDALAKRVEAQEDAARASFEAQKIAAMSQAAIQTALAVSQALASAPPPYNALPAGIAFAAGVAEETAIASEQPAFHQGGLAPDEAMARVLPGEFWVSRQGVAAAGGPEAFNRANAGVSTSMGGDVYAITAYRHTIQVARYERDRLSRNSPTMQEITKGRTPGVRGL